MTSIIGKIVSFLVVHTAWADGGNTPGGTQSIVFPNPLHCDTFNCLVDQIIQNMKYIALPIVAILIIYSGYLFLTSGGNSEQVTKARRTLLYTALGYALILTVDMLSTLIRNVLNGS